MGSEAMAKTVDLVIDGGGMVDLARLMRGEAT